jgi:hypothetical protein
MCLCDERAGSSDPASGTTARGEKPVSSDCIPSLLRVVVTHNGKCRDIFNIDALLADNGDLITDMAIAVNCLMFLSTDCFKCMESVLVQYLQHIGFLISRRQ